MKLNQDRFPAMSSSSHLVRVQEGAVVCGVCKGLEVSGRGSAKGWRIIFVVSTLFVWLPAFIYAGMAILIPLKNNEDDIKNSDDINKIEVELERLQTMKDKGLITDEEFSKMKEKTLQI